MRASEKNYPIGRYPLDFPLSKIVEISANILFWNNPIPGSSIGGRRVLWLGGACRSPSNPRNMPGLLTMLVAVRHAAGVRQQKLAEKLGKPQSFVAKYEGGERRIDLVEFIAIARALDADPVKLFRDFVAGEPGPKPRRKSPAK